jgi:hypothetical protein
MHLLLYAPTIEALLATHTGTQSIHAVIGGPVSFLKVSKLFISMGFACLFPLGFYLYGLTGREIERERELVSLVW